MKDVKGTLMLAAVVLAASATGATRVYKSQNPDGSIVYSDTPPPAVSPDPGRRRKEAAGAEESSDIASWPCGAVTTSYKWKPDRSALLAMLRERRYAALETRLKSMYEPTKGAHCSDRPFGLAFWAFQDASADLEQRYAEWLSEFPHSQWALAARGWYFVNRGYSVRGTKFVRETSAEQFEAMRAEFVKGQADLDEALRIDPTLAVAAVQELSIARNGASQLESKLMYERFLRRMPNSYVLRYAYAFSLQPKWGGDIKTLMSFAAEEAKHDDINPDFALLPSYAMCLASDELRRLDRKEQADAVKRAAADRFGENLEVTCYPSALAKDAGGQGLPAR
ncbi:MAG TPA: DUF4124 domain-containing protein [Rudaea sp.]|nr:DUF4124 domain-containing protein [Rudaea sp.]